MNYPLWSEVCRVLGIIGSVIAVIGTIGYYAFGKIVDRQKNQRIGQLESGNASLKQQLEETSKLAQPSTLELLQAKPLAAANGVAVTVLFRASKNEALGRLTFIADLPDGSPEQIIHLSASLEGGAFQSGDKSEEISPDGKHARFTYIPLGAEIAAIEITVSGASSVRIQGNRLKEPCIIDIPPNT